ncbi:MAG TPA: sigma-70 family RNA polymerase sigma factor [Chloroflexia bacterium]
MHESEAISRLKRGDISGLEGLVRLHQTRAIRASYLISYDYALAEDITQAAFLRAYERIGQFDESKPFGPWFLRGVVNDTLMALRRRHEVSLDDPVLPEDALPPVLGRTLEEALEAAETREEIWATLDRLAPAQRAAIVMRYYLDLSDTEISNRLGVPHGTVRRRLHDARERLRHLLPTWITQPIKE